MELIEQSGSEEVIDNKDVRVSVIRGRKITTTIVSAIPIENKLLMISTKMTLPKGG